MTIRDIPPAGEICRGFFSIPTESDTFKHGLHKIVD